jgi:hypothetical protein
VETHLFDLSPAYGTTGAAIGYKTITGKYVGEFEGVNLYESKMMGDVQQLHYRVEG